MEAVRERSHPLGHQPVNGSRHAHATTPAPPAAPGRHHHHGAARPARRLGPALAGLLFGDYAPSGKLPWQLPGSLADVVRPGGTDVPADAVESWDLPYDLGATTTERAQIRASIDAGQPPATTYGNPLYPYGAGMTGF